jgi:polyphosphate kinase
MLKRVSGIGPERLFAVVLVPNVLQRFVSVEPDDMQNFVLLEDMIACRLPELFGGYDIIDHATFRLTRDMDVNLWTGSRHPPLDRNAARVRTHRGGSAEIRRT